MYADKVEKNGHRRINLLTGLLQLIAFIETS